MAILFWSLFGVVVWCYVGYPVFMLGLARIRPRPTDVGDWTPRISVVLAVRNEQDRIATRIENLRAQSYPQTEVEIIVACNGCTDETESRVSALQERDPALRLVVGPESGGKSEALNRGVEAATGEVIVFADARQRFEPDVFLRLAERLSDPSVGAVSGRLVIDDSDSAAVEGVRKYWQIEVALRRAESETGSVVGATGAVYAIRRALYTPLPPALILDDVLTPMRIVAGGRRVVFAHEAVAHDEASPDPSTEFRRKVRSMVGNLQILRAEPRLLSPRANPILGRYIAHKLLRLLAPLCLLGMLAAGALAEGPLYTWLVLAQLGFYALGAVGLVLPLPGLGIPAGFLLVHVAVLLALFQPTKGAEALWGSGR